MPLMRRTASAETWLNWTPIVVVSPLGWTQATRLRGTPLFLRPPQLQVEPELGLSLNGGENDEGHAAGGNIGEHRGNAHGMGAVHHEQVHGLGHAFDHGKTLVPPVILLHPHLPRK